MNGIYASAYLKAHGTPCAIQRPTPVSSKVDMKRVSNSADPATRDGVWTGLILKESALASGDVFTAGGDSYLVQSVRPVSGALEWFAVKCNAAVEHWRFTEEGDEDGNIIVAWVKLADSVAWGQIVTANLRQADPGLLDRTKYLFQVPKALGVQVLDRFVYGGNAYQVESIDDVAMEGVVRVQLSDDLR